MLENMVTDRTTSDLYEVEQLAKAIKAGTATSSQVQQYLNRDYKGAYTYRDMNRVEEAVQYVAQRLQDFGYAPDILYTRTWTVQDCPTERDLARYFGNVASLRSAISVGDSTPEAPDSVIGFDVDGANALEQILVDIDRILSRIATCWFYSGDLYSSEV